MKKFLLPEGYSFFKANLHCHTDVSDGKLSPQQVKDAYKANGYSVVAFTDHELMVPHPELSDETFLPLNGYELEVLDDNPPGSGYRQRKTCHMCLIALEPDNLNHVCWNRLYVNPRKLEKFRHVIHYHQDLPDYRRIHSGSGITDVMQIARNSGFFVTYNHPNWSHHDMTDIAEFHGMHALEIYNHGSVAGGYDDYNSQIYDAMLRRNQRVYCIAADDNHNTDDQFGGWTMICAEKLAYRAVTSALENGHFYASTGPRIHALWFEDGMIHIRCSPARKIVASFGVRKRNVQQGDALTEASFAVTPEDMYVRLTVWDDAGNHADTNAYFTDDLFQ